jgi:hypothetical protein
VGTVVGTPKRKTGADYSTFVDILDREASGKGSIREKRRQEGSKEGVGMV